MPLQIRLTVLGQGTAGAGADVAVTAPADTPLQAVLGALAGAVAPGSAAPAAVFCEDGRLDPRTAVLGRPPLVDGAVLSFHHPLDGPLPEPVPARLMVVAGPDAGGVHLLRGGVVRIGRSAEADVPLDDPDVSRSHCAVTVAADGSVTVTDLGSTNGTLLDGRPVTGGPVPLPPGGVLRLGESVLRITPGGTPAVPPGDPATRWPDLAALLLAALAPGEDAGGVLWGRTPADPDAFGVRLGTAHRDAGVPPPVTVALREAGALGLAGPRPRVTALARAALAQLAALHPPSALELVAVAPGRAGDWSWLGWLPHTRPLRGQDCELLLAFDAAQTTARLRELAGAPHGASPARRTVVLVDGDPADPEARATLARLAAEGPAAGVHLLVLAETPPATAASPVEGVLAAARQASPAFAACGAAAVLSGPVATSLRLVGRDGAAGPPAGADAVSAAWAERFARALAPRAERPAAPGGDAAARPSVPLPESCRLLDALELGRVTPGTLRDRWNRRPAGLPLVLGIGVAGPVALDLADATAPVAVTGPPGSGRTELLTAAAAALATARSPEELSLLLVEGARDGLLPAAELPHVTARPGASDPVRLRAFAQELREELKRRAALLGDALAPGRAAVFPPRSPGDGPEAGAAGRGRGATAAALAGLPWLVVLVDDLEALLAPPLGAPGRQAAGSVVRALDAVAREGHRLKARLVTTAGPAAPAAPWEAGISVRLTGAPVGRGELRRPGRDAVPLQAGRVTGRIPRTATLRPTVARVDWARAGDPPVRRPVRELGNGPTDVALLASAAGRAANTDRAATLV